MPLSTTPDPTVTASPRINGGMLDSDTDDGDAPSAALPQTYLSSADALVTAVQQDGGLTLANINKYLPQVKAVLGNVASAFPGAGTAIGAVLKILPDQIG